MEMINLSEGQKQKQINEALGKSEEILTIAKATAESIEKIGTVLNSPGGVEAFELKLKEKYLGTMNHLADGSVEIIVPGSINQYETWLENLGLSKK